jgi:hypothetical protein
MSAQPDPTIELIHRAIRIFDELKPFLFDFGCLMAIVRYLFGGSHK